MRSYRKIRVTVEETGVVLGDEVEVAESFSARSIGLLGRRELLPGSGLHILRCRMVHMWFMRFAIDAVFLDRLRRIVGIDASLQPWRLSRWWGQADSVLELPAGSAEQYQLIVGQRIRLEENDQENSAASSPYK
ncbi:MAG: DUF192 domain-containing protein [Bdellovibrionales bacterium]|nr:DUF192 domain-containing protein [Bdellovibrionales bacterium]